MCFFVFALLDRSREARQAAGANTRRAARRKRAVFRRYMDVPSKNAPADCESKSRSGLGAPPGCAFFWLLFFAQARKSDSRVSAAFNSAAGQRFGVASKGPGTRKMTSRSSVKSTPPQSSPAPCAREDARIKIKRGPSLRGDDEQRRSSGDQVWPDAHAITKKARDAIRGLFLCCRVARTATADEEVAPPATMERGDVSGVWRRRFV